jgi:hypothetical protein
MRTNIKLIISGILSLFALFFLLSLSNINNQKISAKQIYFNIYGCYELYSNNSYFIIYPIESALNFEIIPIEYINTSKIIICNENVIYNKTLEICTPTFCPMICNIEGCYPCHPTCYNETFYINISYPVIIITNSFNYNISNINLAILDTYVVKYNNNLYCIGQCNINIIKLPDNYLYNLISEIINSIPIITV